MALDGAQVLLLVNTGTDASPNYVEVGQQTNLSKETTRNLIETTSKEDDHQKFIYGKQGDTVTLESLYVPNDSAMSALRDANDNKNNIKIRRKEQGSEVEEADALVETISDEWPDNDNSTTSVDLTLDGAWTSI